MANGDAAAQAGMDLVSGIESRRDGWDEINKTRDYIALFATTDASKIISGTLGVARVPNLPASKVTSGVFHSDRVPNLNASKITAGTLHVNRLPSIPWSKVTGEPATFPPAAHTHTSISADGARVYCTSDATGPRIVADTAYNRDYDTVKGDGVRLAVLTDSDTLGTANHWAEVGEGYNIKSDGPRLGAYNRSATGSGHYSTWMNSDRQWMRNTSSARYKTDIETMGDCLASVMQLRPVTYVPKANPDMPSIGLIAEEVAEVYPQIVPLEDGQPEAVNYEFLVAPLIGALQEQQAMIERLEQRIADLEDRA